MPDGFQLEGEAEVGRSAQNAGTGETAKTEAGHTGGADSPSSAANWRQQLVAAVAAQLARLPDPTSPSAVTDLGHLAAGAVPASPAQAPDLFSLLSELAALRQEVRLQSRTQDRAARAMEQAQVGMQASAETQRQVLEASERAAQQAESWRGRAHLTPFLGLRDVLERALAHAASSPPRRWWRRWQSNDDRGRASFDTLLVAFDRALAQLGVVPFAAVGDVFDPQTMVAIGVGHDPLAADGVVTQVARGGFTCGEQLLRSAEVVVNRQALLPKVLNHA